jgi:putative lipoic acid-binding regulatory protein
MAEGQDGAGAGKAVVDYPCLYRFRAIGFAGGDFPSHVRRLVGRVIGPVAPDSCSVRASAGGRYESVTVHVHLESEEARRAIYQEFWEDERVVFYL